MVNGSGKPCMIRLPFNFVEYDSNPSMAFEPINHVPYCRAHNLSDATNNYVPVNPRTDGSGVVAGIEIFDAPPFAEVQEFHFI
jgi:hypothetical protein